MMVWSRRSIRLLATLAAIVEILALAASAADAPQAARKPRLPGIKVGKIPVEIRTVATTADGLPNNDVWAIALLPGGDLYAGTSHGMARLDGKVWKQSPTPTGAVKLLAAGSDPRRVLAASADGVQSVQTGLSEPLAPLPHAAATLESLRSLAWGQTVLLGTKAGLFELHDREFVAVDALNALLGLDKDVRQVAVAPDGHIAVAAAGGLFLKAPKGSWERLDPYDGTRSWAPRDVRGVAFDAKGRMWFASPTGAGWFDRRSWSLYTGQDGLPYNDFTTMAAGGGGEVWFGTKLGAIRFDDGHWNYRQGYRWLPDDNVRGIAVSPKGDAWFATSRGVGRIERRPMTLAEKAIYFEDAIDRYHRRTPYQYVLEVSLDNPGDLSHPMQHDSDNDGLWTGMYGAGECFAYAATHDPRAKERATMAFKALKFLSDVTQGGEHPAPRGFPARSILPTSGPDPNQWDSPERDRRDHANDPLWKVITPRWPKSADGKWYWKTDTSSDELDGHFFLYSLYYDLVAQTEAEREPVRQVVGDIVTHLLEHDFDLIDHDEKPTRWARFGPQALNRLEWATGRGLNSLSILSYLLVAEHVTGDKKYQEAFDRLVKDHAYLANIIFPKEQTGPGTGNQSDDEMAFMSYYNLMAYAKDPLVRRAGNMSLRWYWELEQPEQCPLFNYIFAASFDGFGRSARSAPPSSIADALDCLKRFPLDRVDWGYKNSHRLDVISMDRFGRRSNGGHLRNGKTVPIDEQFVEHWNHDPWQLDRGEAGRNLADGASFLLPYYMGRYLGFIIEDPSSSLSR